MDTEFDSTDLIPKIFGLIMPYLKSCYKGENRVNNHLFPSDLKSDIDFSLAGEPYPEDEVVELCKKIQEHSVKAHHKRFYS
jgi:hypothetical protein